MAKRRRKRERVREKECERESDLAGALKSFGSLNEPLTRIPESGPVRFQYQKWKWKWIWVDAETARLPAMPPTPPPLRIPHSLSIGLQYSARWLKLFPAAYPCAVRRCPAQSCLLVVWVIVDLSSLSLPASQIPPCLALLQLQNIYVNDAEPATALPLFVLILWHSYKVCLRICAAQYVIA